ncbi:MAG: IgGFc-binding protein, partial [Candidatus Kapaibacterium sp.]
MSYTADPSSQASAGTPSQFAIVATEDSTEVRIETDEPIYRYGRIPGVVRLNKGDVYLVQSQVGDSRRLVDLTGTYVASTKPIALFSGHQRATIPIEDDRRSSRDCLIEQMTPISTWGRGALLVPYPEPSDAMVFTGDKYRILAAYDSTEVYIDSVFVTTLDAGRFFEGELRGPHSVLATRAVMVAQFKHTSSLTSPGGNTTNMLGDPFMMMIPPSNQFLKSYRFVNVQATKRNNYGDIVNTYEEQWLSVVLPNSARASLKVDGIAPTVTFRPIPKSTYSYIQMRMTDGVHTVEADTGVGIYVYGYGIANSYGYVGGMAYKRYDFNAPRLFGASRCLSYRGFVYDTALADTKVAKVVLMKDSVDNVAVTIEQFIPPADSVAVSAVLIDELRDGYFKVESRDIEGFVGRQRVDVPGYTLRVMDTAGTVEVVKRHAYAAGLRRTYCQDYFLVNTGRFDQTVKDLRMASTASAYTLRVPPLPLSVKPGDTIPFTMCYRFDAEGDYLDTVLVDMGCGPRTLITSTVVAGEDTSSVRITYQDNDCRSQRTILLREDARFQTGVRDITVKDSTNCTFSIAFNAVRTRMTATVGNTDQDAWYTLVVTDSVGNTAMLTDTIEGFTIRYASVGTPATKRLRSAAFLGESVDTIIIENYGAFAKTFDDLPMRQNQLFSIPQHQLPFVVKPGERKEVEIRYSMTRYPPFADSV